MAESTSAYQWPFIAAGAVILSALIVRKTYSEQLKNFGKLQRENGQLKNEIELLKRQIDVLREKISDQDSGQVDNILVRDLQNVCSV
jgi:cell division protein FtsB